LTGGGASAADCVSELLAGFGETWRFELDGQRWNAVRGMVWMLSKLATQSEDAGGGGEFEFGDEPADGSPQVRYHILEHRNNATTDHLRIDAFFKAELGHNTRSDRLHRSTPGRSPKCA